ncbi:hypothetical protein V1L54_03750 [Streptomyces sp. TRM 70361]|uniref:hypothetical protein n=1 Tax=Streptomyces sp. TRM 70361 TaxID=3116553 RepID=UPI002E7B9033|nr:hypothetical protein [Streptomyces sp. TRM 70361]MEE1938534.1 hypothetical protein [Streptomyces sp. TRM 70361]
MKGTKRPEGARRARAWTEVLRPAGPGAAREAAARAALAECVHDCAGRLAALAGPDRPGDPRLVAALGALTAAYTAHAARAGRSGPAADRDTFDALLRAGDRALAAGPAADGNGAGLALRLADTALAVRRRSRGAQLLRARALEALGREAAAAEAYERHLELCEPGPGARTVAAHLATLTERRDCLTGALRLFPADDCAEARALAEAVAQERPAAEVRAAFTACVGRRLREHGAADPAVRRLAALYATYCRLSERDRMPDPLLGGAEPVGVWDLRNAVAGRTVCLVANTRELAGHPPDPGVDDYDLVIRCDAFPHPAPGAGERTDIHVLDHRTTARLDHPVDIRLLLGDPAEQWRQAVRRLVPGAQRRVGDDTLRRPVTDPDLIGEGAEHPAPGTAFSVLRLLDFLDAVPVLDLIGFDLPGPGRLGPAERAWVEARATDRTPTRISLR